MYSVLCKVSVKAMRVQQRCYKPSNASWSDEKSWKVSQNQIHRTKFKNINYMCKVHCMSQTLPNVTWQNVTNVTKRYITKACVKTDSCCGFLKWRCGVDQYLPCLLCWPELKIQSHFTEFRFWSYAGQEHSFFPPMVSAFWLYQVLLKSTKNINTACVWYEREPMKIEIFHYFDHKRDPGPYRESKLNQIFPYL